MWEKIEKKKKNKKTIVSKFQELANSTSSQNLIFNVAGNWIDINLVKTLNIQYAEI